MRYDIWCRCLKRYREQQELTQQAVADGMDISRSHYSAIEHGRTVIHYVHLYNLARFFRVKLDDLIGFRMLKGKQRKTTTTTPLQRGRPKKRKK